MKYKKIDMIYKEDKDIIALSHCNDCNYSGNKGIWYGTKDVAGEIIPVQEIVDLKIEDMWDMEKIVRDTKTYKFISGSVKCPICGSSNFY